MQAGHQIWWWNSNNPATLTTQWWWKVIKYQAIPISITVAIWIWWKEIRCRISITQIQWWWKMIRECNWIWAQIPWWTIRSTMSWNRYLSSDLIFLRPYLHLSAEEKKTESITRSLFQCPNFVAFMSNCELVNLSPLDADMVSISNAFFSIFLIKRVLFNRKKNMYFWLSFRINCRRLNACHLTIWA